MSSKEKEIRGETNRLKENQKRHKPIVTNFIWIPMQISQFLKNFFKVIEILQALGGY